MSLRRKLRRFTASAMAICMLATSGSMPTWAAELAADPVPEAVENGKVTIEESENGTVELVNEATEEEGFPAGTQIQLLVTADEGYTIDAFTVTKAESMEDVAYNALGGGQMVFTMPEEDVTVAATFKEQEVTLADDLQAAQDAQAASIEAAQTEQTETEETTAAPAEEQGNQDGTTMEEADSYTVYLRPTAAKFLGFDGTEDTSVTAKAGDTVTVNVTSGTVDVTEFLVYDNASGELLHSDDEIKDAYSFTMPEQDVIITVSVQPKINTLAARIGGVATVISNTPSFEYSSVGWGTGSTAQYTFSVDGSTFIVYCAEPNRATPKVGAQYTYNPAGAANGTYWTGTTPNADINNAAKVLYYGYGGPSDVTWLFASTDAERCIMTHVALAQVIYDDWNNTSADPDYKLNATGYAKAMEYRNWAISQSIPDGVQVFIADSGTGQTTSGSLGQMLFGLSYVPPQNGKMQLQKVSGNSTITDWNPNYSRENAQYGVYRSAADAYNDTNRVGTLTTDALGNSNQLEVSAGTYYVLEKVSSKGYTLDTTLHTVNVTAGQTATFTSYEPPLNDPIGISIQKMDADGNTVSAEGAGSLEGAEFTLRYYAVDPNTIGSFSDLSGVNPTRTWTLRTLYNEYLQGYSADLADENWVSGDAFYYDSMGVPVFPVGVVTVQETKAPTGYTLDNSVTDSSGNAVLETQNGVTLIRFNNLWNMAIVRTSNGVEVGPDNPIAVKEQVIRGGVTVGKNDSETDKNSPQGGATFEGATFQIISLNANDVVVEGRTYGNGQVVKTFEIAEGETSWRSAADLLPYGNYRIVEIDSPEGYLLMGTTQKDFAITYDGQMVDLTGTNAIEDDVIRGGVRIEKRDAENRDTTPQGGATLTGGTYAITTLNDSDVVVEGHTYSKGQVVKTATIPAGQTYWESAADLLPYGHYSVIETDSPLGYLLPDDLEATEFQIEEDGVIVDLTGDHNAFFDPVIRGGLKVEKHDFESGDNVPQGAASLDEFSIDIITLNANPVLVEGTWYANGAVVKSVDVDGSWTSAKNLLPYGTYKVVETAGPEGYLLDGKTEVTFSVTEDGKIVDLGAENNTIADQVVRGDFRFNKRDLNTNRDMANIPFEITSQSTGESHIVVTDENGQYNSESAYIPHSQDTNGGTVNSGLWFGLDSEGKNVPVDDSLGALPYDTYTITELPCEGNEGKVLYSGSFTISRNDYVLDLGTIYNEDQPPKGITTLAVDEETGTKYGMADEDATIVDTVSYYGLEEGSAYRLVGTLMDKSTGEAVVNADGEPITAERRFNAAVSGHGEIENTFRFDATAYAGKDVVVFEELYDGSGDLIAEHKEIDDLDQTISYPSIGTSVMDLETGDQISMADDRITLVDTVEYHNVQVGRILTVTGILYDKTTGRPALDDYGSQITAEATFIPSRKDGTVDVTFVFSGVRLAGTEVVAFETLERANVEYAVHADINDESQMSYIPGISTTALDDTTNKHISNPDTVVSVTEKISYESLLPGQEYVATASFVSAETGDQLYDAQGNAIRQSVTFTAEEQDGEVSIPFTFDGSNLEGFTGVMTETITFNGVVVAEETSLDNEDQTIHFSRIRTEALDDLTEMHIAKAGDISFKDRLSYENLIPGETYVATATAMDAEAQTPARDADGDIITATTTFTARSADGEVELQFDFDGSNLAGKTLVVFDSVTLNGNEVGYHRDYADTNQQIQIPAVSTTLSDSETDFHVAYADDEVIVTDEIQYENLLPGYSYVLTSELRQASTGEVLPGRNMTQRQTFTPDTPDGTLTVTWTIDATDLQDDTVVAYEDIAIRKNFYTNVSVAEHKILTDEGQSVRFPEIGTIAADSETRIDITKADGDATVIDTIEFHNLVAGVQYVAKGWMVDAETGEVMLDDNGAPIEAQRMFVPEDNDGTVDVTFRFQAETLEGRTGVFYEEVYYNGVLVADHKELSDTNQDIHFPMIRTEALDSETGDHASNADGSITVTDTISFWNLPEHEYVATGTLMNADTGEAYTDANGNPITASTTFTPKEPDGTVEVVFDFDGTGKDPSTFTVFENVTLNGVSVAEHSELADENQQIRIPAVGTTAIDSDTELAMSYADGTVTIEDTVTTTNILEGRNYKIKGIVMDQATGQPMLDASGNQITSEISFTAENRNETHQVDFSFDGSQMAGKTVVVFEELFQVLEDGTEVSVANHQDLSDVGQTVVFPHIYTRAYDEDTTFQVSASDGTRTIVDEFSYENVLAGLQYEIRGTIVDADTGEAIKDVDGNEVTLTHRFTAASTAGMERVEYTFDAEGLAGHTLTVMQELYINGVIVAKDLSDALEPETIYIPKITTSVSDQSTGLNITFAGENAVVTDRVSYANALVGHTYRVEGQFYDAETGEPVVDSSGNAITSSAEFTVPDTGAGRTASGTVDVTFTFNASGMDGRTIVCYEDLYLGDNWLTSHHDLSSEAQSIHIPRVGTTAVGEETGVRLVYAGEKAMIRDTVKYENVLPNHSYTIVGELRNGETGAALLDDHGNPVTGTATFTAEAEDGTCDVTFTFDAATLAGTETVAFERLYINTDDRGSVIVGTHEILSDENQTVYLPHTVTASTDDESGLQVTPSDGERTITDRISYDHVIPGLTYEIRSRIIDVETGETLLDVNGDEVTASKTFVPAQASGEESVSFTYDISGLAGKDIRVLSELYYDGHLVSDDQADALEPETLYVPEISTSVEDAATGLNITYAGENATITDHVQFDNLLVGQTYRLDAIYMDAETGEPAVDGDGNEIRGTATFTVPDDGTSRTASGTVDVTVTFNAEGMDGKTIVCYEDLYLNDYWLTDHHDLSDDGQSIHIPKVSTIATGVAAGEQIVYAGEQAVIRDTVKFENVLPNHSYTISGVIMDGETGEALLDDHGNQITASATFTAEQADGSVDLTFTFDADTLAGTETIAFEELYINTDDRGSVLVGDHKDLEDSDQRVLLPHAKTASTDDATGLQITASEGERTITDQVSYDHLKTGLTYEVRSRIIDLDTNEVLKTVDGEDVTATTTFVPENEEGVVDVTFTFNAAGLEGKDIRVLSEVYYNDVLIADDQPDALEPETLYIPKIGTSVADQSTGLNITYAGEDAYVVDTVAFENLLVGQTYTLQATFMDAETGEAAVDGDGKPITGTAEFTVPDNGTDRTASGTAEVTIRFNAADMDGKTIVCFEDLYLNRHWLTKHHDLTSEEQSIHIPKVSTSAIGVVADEQLVYAGEQAVIKDTVQVENILPGQSYEIRGVVYNQETGEPLLDDHGQEIRSSAAFVAEAADVTVDLTFTFDADTLAGTKTVVYEELYIVTDHGNVIVGDHKEQGDTDQQVWIPYLQTVSTDDATGLQLTASEGERTITDQISYDHILPGLTYEVRSRIVDVETGETIKTVDGADVTATTTFVPEEESGEVSVSFTFDTVGLAGKDIRVLSEIYYNGVLIADDQPDALEPETLYIPEIGTSVSDDDTGMKMSFADDTVTITDTVSYRNLLTNVPFTLKAVLMDKETGEVALDAEGEEIRSEASFMVSGDAKTTDGTVDVKFVFDATGLDGKTVVAFEELYYDDVWITSHENLESPEQTLVFPKVETSAIGTVTGEQLLFPEEDAVIEDTIFYSTVIAGENYLLVGTLADQETGEALVDENGDPLTAETTFTAEETSGTETMEFIFDATGMEGKTIVVYEDLYVETEDGYVQVGQHMDQDSEEQMVFIPEISTSLVDDVTENDMSEASKDMSFTDTLSYRNLKPGLSYTASGVLVDPETEEPVLDDNGEEIRGETTFVPEEADGTIEVKFTFDGETLEGKTLVAFEELTFEGNLIAIHKDAEDLGQTIVVPKIRTNATDMQTGTQNSNADSTVTIEDEVSFDNLYIGREYTVEGMLMDKATGEPLLDANGNTITASTTFIAGGDDAEETGETISGTVTLTFTFDGSALAGTTAVAFETLYYDGKEVAVHADLSDEDQTIWFPSLETEATDTADGDHTINGNGIVNIRDQVTFTGLIVGERYRLEGVLMDKATGMPFLVNGQAVTAETTFVPETSDGTVEVMFTFDVSGLTEDMDLVAFERLYLADTDLTDEDALVGSHEDLTDESQTVHVIAPPVVQTDDNTQAAQHLGVVIVAAIILAAAGISTLVSKKRKKK